VDYSRFLLDTPIAHPGSCSWLLENEKFSDWLTSSGSGAFWLHGHPGRGKTVLARFIIETLKNIPDSYPKLHNLKSFKVIHYILLEQDKERGSITKILRSLLHQFILEDPSLASTIQHLFGLERKLTKPHENCDTLWNAIRGILALEALKRAVIIIDALDELDPGTLAALINGFSSIILHLRERLPDRKIKIVVTSRPDECIDKLLNKINPVKLEISSNDGVASFIRNEVLAFGERYQFPDRISQQIITEIVNKADGMFLWASLAWANFQEGVTFWSTRTIDTQLEALQKQPRGLESLYSSILSKINQKTLQELRPLFQCVIAAHRPLSCTEMAEALAVQTCDNHRELITVFSIAKSIDKSCPNFLKIDNDGTIRFVHQSVKDFFVNGIDGMDLMSSHSSMARICITYLNFKDLPKPINRWSFLRYGDLDEVSKRFSLLYYCSFWLYTHLDNLPTNNTLWVSFSQLLLANKCDAYRRSAYYHPMLLAIDKGSRLLVGSFLKAGCNVNERLNGLPPLHYAIKLNKVDVAFFLLEYGADVNSVDEKNRVPLHFAIQGRDLLLVEKLLAYRELDINVQDSDGRTCLHWAVSEDSGDILRNLLIDKRINIDLVDNNKQTPLVSAAYWGEKLGVQMIVEHSTSLQHHQEMDLSPIICVAQQVSHCILFVSDQHRSGYRAMFLRGRRKISGYQAYQSGNRVGKK
jgi:ankyrin repeat protein